MAKMTGGAAVVEALRQEAVTHVFGLIGSSTMEIFDALHGCEDITYIGVRHEQNAVHMADAYARVRGRAAVVLAGQNGPGATNLVTGLAQAQLAFSPVVAIAGYAASSHLDKGSFQEIDQHALFSPITKRTLTAHSASRLPEYLRDAFRISQSGRRGPVVINIPRDLLAAEVDVQFQSPETYRSSVGSAPSRSALERAAALLNGAQRPLILAGAGVKWARATACTLELAETLQAPVAASAGHADVVPNDHPLYAGQVGPRGNRVATDLARSADVILALGTRLGFNTTFYTYDNLSPEARIIQVDVEPAAVGRYFPVTVPVVADAGEMAAALIPLIRPASERGTWISEFQLRRQRLLEERASVARREGSALQPAAVFAAVQSVLPRNAIVTLDAGTCCLQATDVLKTFEPPSLLTPLDFGLVGFSFAAGLGAKAAAPDRPVISLMGDGGFGMTMGEIGTAIRAHLSTVTVIMNNDCWGAEKAYQRDFYGGRYIGADTTNPRFDVVARAFGAQGVRAETAEDLAFAVEDGLRQDKLTVIEVPVDPDAIVSFRRDSFTHRANEAAPATATR